MPKECAWGHAPPPPPAARARGPELRACAAGCVGTSGGAAERCVPLRGSTVARAAAEGPGRHAASGRYL